MGCGRQPALCPFLLAAACACSSSIAAQGSEDAGTAADVRVRHAPPHDSGAADGPWPAENRAPPAAPTCPLFDTPPQCRPPGLTCDVAAAVPCCGACIEAVCCAARGQACDDARAVYCCVGLRCGAGCKCE